MVVSLYYIIFGITEVYAMEPERYFIMEKITDINNNIKYFDEQTRETLRLRNLALHNRDNLSPEEVNAYEEAYKETLTNLESEKKAKLFYEKKLLTGNYSTDLPSSAGSKRKATEELTKPS